MRLINSSNCLQDAFDSVKYLKLINTDKTIDPNNSWSCWSFLSCRRKGRCDRWLVGSKKRSKRFFFCVGIWSRVYPPSSTLTDCVLIFNVYFMSDDQIYGGHLPVRSRRHSDRNFGCAPRVHPVESRNAGGEFARKQSAPWTVSWVSFVPRKPWSNLLCAPKKNSITYLFFLYFFVFFLFYFKFH